MDRVGEYMRTAAGGHAGADQTGPSRSADGRTGPVTQARTADPAGHAGADSRPDSQGGADGQTGPYGGAGRRAGPLTEALTRGVGRLRTPLMGARANLLPL